MHASTKKGQKRDKIANISISSQRTAWYGVAPSPVIGMTNNAQASNPGSCSFTSPEQITHNFNRYLHATCCSRRRKMAICKPTNYVSQRSLSISWCVGIESHGSWKAFQSWIEWFARLDIIRLPRVRGPLSQALRNYRSLLWKRVVTISISHECAVQCIHCTERARKMLFSAEGRDFSS